MKNSTIYRFLGALLSVLLTILPTPATAETLMKMRANVTGTLYFEPGHGYFISANPHADASQRVWLFVSEQKSLVRDLENLKGKFVQARGPLEQIPATTKAVFPPYSMCLSDFSIALASDKDLNRN
jgi:hypothetical protein